MNFDQLRHQVIEIAIFTFLIILLVAFCLALWIFIVYLKDKHQSKHAVLRNFPVIGHFRYLFEHLGHFFRQYFFATDREELPFNRAERSWVYRAAKDVDTTAAFGSTRPHHETGTVIFVNGAFPTLKKNSEKSKPLIIGADCPNPYSAPSFFNVSAMSYGALSKPAVQALSSGCKMAQCWLNTGEGGISPFHLEGGCDLVAQIGTAKYGYRTLSGEFDEEKIKQAARYTQVKMFEIKLSQGAKPGKGGMLPAAKVNEEIAEIRGIEPFQDSISPNRFPELNTVSDILDMIDYIRQLTEKPVGFKAVIGSSEWLHD